MKYAAIVGALLALSQTAGAALIYTSARVDPGFASPDDASQEFHFDTTQNSSSASKDSDFGSSEFSGSANSTADFGILKAFAQAIITNYQGVNFYGPCPSFPSVDCSVNPAESYASFGDTFTFTGGSGTGYLVLDIAITGAADWVGTLGADAGAQGILNVSSGTENLYGGTLVKSYGFTGPLNVTTPAIAFTYGTPLSLNVALQAFVWVIDQNLDSDEVYSHSGTANYGSTAEITGLRVYSDSSLQNAVSASLTTNSGTDYPLADVPGGEVPEPASMLGVAGGLVALIVARRRR